MFLTLLTSPPKLALRVLEAPLIVWFGRRSYSIYLWHLGINAYFLIKFPQLGQLWIAVGRRDPQREYRGSFFSVGRVAVPAHEDPVRRRAVLRCSPSRLRQPPTTRLCR